MTDFPVFVRGRSPHFGRRYLYLAVTMSVVASAAIAGLSLDLVVKASGSSPLVEVAIITLLVWVYPTSYLVARARDFYLRDGILHLPLPIRRTGRRTWEVPLGDVVQATALHHEDGDTGVCLVLVDGAEARLWLSDMPPGGKEFLELLLKSYGGEQPPR